MSNQDAQIMSDRSITDPSFWLFTYAIAGDPAIEPGKSVTVGLGFGKAGNDAYASPAVYATQDDYKLEITSSERVRKNGVEKQVITVKNDGTAAVNLRFRMLLSKP